MTGELPPHHLIPRVSAAEIDECIDGLVETAGESFAGEEVTLISIYLGAKWFGEQFALKLAALPCPPSSIRQDNIRISSYAKGMKTNGKPRVVEDLQDPEGLVRGKKVLLLEDIIDSGLSIARTALPHVLKYQPVSLEVVTMLTKFEKLRVSRQELCLLAHGLNIDFFAVGSGLDFEGYYRDLAGVWEVVKDE
ncbi:MAG: Hypoxanthine phosphoribosyltransferase [uncultured bacterium]|nr:MAG: Hypoxanthine phosphoribosyltransferase [uncultured bacterium]KKU13815.1 MAG: hypothetical protein UX21_C0035G0005 [Microgenomates group bacterium GW2011_GWC2_45_8]KKU25762.1 MAG: hypothetical protein UX37_C0013G0007 [Microgenomates group bacterium GW2011_GWA2_46_16]